MKKKLIALVCALALAVGLVGCSLSTPDSVGTIGEVDISSGLYLLAQFDAYQTAADLASDDQDATKVSSFLKATITVDDATGETAVVSDYVAQKTLENLESYAAIETRFDELGVAPFLEVHLSFSGIVKIVEIFLSCVHIFSLEEETGSFKVQSGRISCCTALASVKRLVGP